jgi:hypothetical protein
METNKKVKVWIASRGEEYEGSSVIGVFSSKKKAKRAALNEPTHFPGGWVKKDKNYWMCGCDFLMIERYYIE